MKLYRTMQNLNIYKIPNNYRRLSLKGAEKRSRQTYGQTAISIFRIALLLKNIIELQKCNRLLLLY